VRSIVSIVFGRWQCCRIVDFTKDNITAAAVANNYHHCVYYTLAYGVGCLANSDICNWTLQPDIRVRLFGVRSADGYSEFDQIRQCIHKGRLRVNTEFSDFPINVL